MAPFSLMAAIFLALHGDAPAGKPIRNDTAWRDAAGRPISCHDGGISRFGDTFYWYGTSYRGTSHRP